LEAAGFLFLDLHQMAEPYNVIAVPGSTSNLGPAFDALSVALDLYLRIEVRQVRADLAGAVRYEFDGPAPDGENRIDSAYQLACRRYGRPVMGIEVGVSSRIPMAAGLGSSAAATIAGLRLYEAARAIPLDPDDMLGLATEVEGHPDNAAAALHGGITLSCQTATGVLARTWRWPAEVRFVIATPDVGLATTHARAALPASIPLGDAVANLQRALLLVRALETGRYDDLREALADRWHQPARGPLVPALAECVTIDHPSVLGVCLSGAGPSVLALAAPGRSEEASGVLGEVYRRLDVPYTVRNLAAVPPESINPASPAQRERTA
jgi:homoserine kinase